MSSRTAPHAVETDDARRDKSVLFCPECGHESPLGGDWIARQRGGQTVVSCPVCGTTVANRRRTAA